MGRWSHAELETAFEQYQAQVVAAAHTRDWTLFASMFTEDATYIEHAYGRFSGREEIRSWVVETMTSFPGNEMTSFPVTWHTVDEERGRIICEILNVMRDPGDGSSHEATNITILTYAGDGLWSCEEDVYNPMRFAAMAKAYVRRCHELGTLSDDGRAWAAAVGIKLAV